MSFHVGQKVVCVDDTFGDTFDYPDHFEYPSAGSVYHIREVVLASDGQACVRLREILNPDNGICAVTGDEGEPRFLARRFRPLVEDRKSVSFTIGADPDSERWDNRRKIKERT